MSNEILNQLLDQVLILQQNLAEKRQEKKELIKKLEQLADGYKKLKQEKEKERKYLLLGGIVFTIIFYLLIKILIAYLF